MKNRSKTFKIVISVFVFLKTVFFTENIYAEENKFLYMVLETGLVKIETYPKFAPKTVKRVINLSNKGFYDGLTFHRVIKGFMAQGGDPNGDGTGGSGENLQAEFNELKHERGIVSMARAQDPDSADSQFFICYDEQPFLDNKYTIWGKVVSGMHLVDRIPEGRGPNGKVLGNPTKIITMRTKN